MVPNQLVSCLNWKKSEKNWKINKCTASILQLYEEVKGKNFTLVNPWIYPYLQGVPINNLFTGCPNKKSVCLWVQGVYKWQRVCQK